MQWVLVPSAEPVYVIECGDVEEPADRYAVLTAALPGFGTVTETHVLVPAEATMLTMEEPRTATPELAARLLGRPGKLAAAAGHDKIVVPLLRALAEDPTHVDLVLAHVRAVVAAWAADDRADIELTNFVKNCAAVVPLDSAVAVDNDAPPDLLGRTGRILLLPQMLAPAGEDQPRGHLAEADATDLLRAAAGLGMKADQLSRLAKQLIEAVEPPANPKDGPLACLPLFLTIPASDEAASLSELAEAAEQGLLYAGGKDWAGAVGSATDLDVLVCGTLPRLDVFGAVAACNAAAARKAVEATARASGRPASPPAADKATAQGSRFARDAAGTSPPDGWSGRGDRGTAASPAVLPHERHVGRPADRFRC